MKKTSFNSLLLARGVIKRAASVFAVALFLFMSGTFVLPPIALAGTVKVPEAVAADGEVFVYTVKKGDTLWDITGTYLKDPFKWPKVWKNNPYIRNPHLIYPGDIVRVTSDGIEIINRKVKLPRTPVDVDSLPVVAVSGEEERVVKLEPEPAPIPRVKGPTVGSNLMKRQGFITGDQFKSSGSIIEPKHNMIMMGEGEEVFVSLNKGHEPAIGERYSIYRLGDKVTHPVTGKEIGYMVDILGSLVITRSSGVSEARIDNSFKEIEAGALLMPYTVPVTEVELTEATSAVKGYVIASLDSSSNFSTGDIVYINRGTDDGLDEGNVLRVYRKREKAVDPVTRKKVKLPPVNLGTMVVLDPGEKTSTCIVLNGQRAMVVGDKVSTVQVE